jgi:hypothetical protein
MPRMAALLALVATACADPEPLPLVEVVPAAVSIPVADTVRARSLLVLVNTADEVYRVDPKTLDVTLHGTFSFPGGDSDRITDIAIDRKGRMWAIGFEAVYRVDPKTFACTLLARHRGVQVNALAVMTSAMLTSEREAPDLLLAGDAYTSTIYRVDPVTGAIAAIGDLGGGLSSSGDLTWAPGVGAVMIVTDRAGYEGVARLEPDTFTAKPLDAGWAYQRVRGLTMLPDALLGVSEQGEMIQIDPTTGAATLGKTHAQVFYGGAVGWDDRPARPSFLGP